MEGNAAVAATFSAHVTEERPLVAVRVIRLCWLETTTIIVATSDVHLAYNNASDISNTNGTYFR
jgi:hypothetical protein